MSLGAWAEWVESGSCGRGRLMRHLSGWIGLGAVLFPVEVDPVVGSAGRR